MTSIYDLSWKKTSFIFKLCLFWTSIKDCGTKIKSEKKEDRAVGYSALSSSYYSIYTTAGSKFKAIFRPKWLIWLAPIRIITWCATWLSLGAWCWWRMLPLSNKVKELLGYDNMPSCMCDVRQSILRARGKYAEAKKCIYTVLNRYGVEDIKCHTLGLLYIAMADIYRIENAPAGMNDATFLALEYAKKAEEVEPLQVDRIYKQCIRLLKLSGKTSLFGFTSTELINKAKELAKKHDAKDQSLKLSV